MEYIFKLPDRVQSNLHHWDNLGDELVPNGCHLFPRLRKVLYYESDLDSISDYKPSYTTRAHADAIPTYLFFQIYVLRNPHLSKISQLAGESNRSSNLSSKVWIGDFATWICCWVIVVCVCCPPCSSCTIGSRSEWCVSDQTWCGLFILNGDCSWNFPTDSQCITFVFREISNFMRCHPQWNFFDTICQVIVHDRCQLTDLQNSLWLVTMVMRWEPWQLCRWNHDYSWHCWMEQSCQFPRQVSSSEVVKIHVHRTSTEVCGHVMKRGGDEPVA